MTKKLVLFPHSKQKQSFATKLRVGDEVYVNSGANTGKTGKILSINRKNNTAVVEGINVRKKHKKPTKVDSSSGIIDINSAISLSNLAYYDAKTKTHSKLRYEDVDGVKTRIMKKTSYQIPLYKNQSS